MLKANQTIIPEIFPLFWSRSPGKGQRDDRAPVLFFASPTGGDPEGDKSHQANRCHTSCICFKHCKRNTGLPIGLIYAGLVYSMIPRTWRIFSEFFLKHNRILRRGRYWYLNIFLFHTKLCLIFFPRTLDFFSPLLSTTVLIKPWWSDY